MDTEQQFGARSVASVFGHPIHHMLVSFPIAFFIGALATDVAAWRGGDAFWARCSFWLLAAGLVVGVLAALVGLVDYASIGKARRLSAATYHAVGNVLVMALAAINLYLRTGADFGGGTWPWPLILSAAVTLLLIGTGWYGGELAYRHGIGVIVPAAYPQITTAAVNTPGAEESPPRYRGAGRGD